MWDLNASMLLMFYGLVALFSNDGRSTGLIQQRVISLSCKTSFCRLSLASAEVDGSGRKAAPTHASLSWLLIKTLSIYMACCLDHCTMYKLSDFTTKRFHLMPLFIPCITFVKFPVIYILPKTAIFWWRSSKNPFPMQEQHHIRFTRKYSPKKLKSNVLHVKDCWYRKVLNENASGISSMILSIRIGASFWVHEFYCDWQ